MEGREMEGTLPADSISESRRDEVTLTPGGPAKRSWAWGERPLRPHW